MKPYLLPLLALATSAQSLLGFTVLVVDVGDTTAVTFTATTNNSAISNSDYTYEKGVTMAGFFSQLGLSVENLPVSRSGDLEIVGGNPLADLYVTDLGSGEFDLNLYLNFNTDTMVFSDTSRAFSGVLTVDFTGYEIYLPVYGDSGDVVAGDGFSGTSAPLGTYEVIPEPSTYAALAGVAALALLAWRRRR